LREGVEARVFAAIPGEEVEGAIAVDFASPDGAPPSFCKAASLAGAIAETRSLSFSEGSLMDVVEGAPARLGVPGPTEDIPPGIGEAVPEPEGEAFEASAFVVDKNFDLSSTNSTVLATPAGLSGYSDRLRLTFHLVVPFPTFYTSYLNS